MTAVRPFVIALTVLTVVLACDRSPTAITPDPAAPLLLANLSKTGGLLPCKPLGYDSATQAIGPAGGVLKISKHNLLVPPGPLAASASTTPVAPPGQRDPVRPPPGGPPLSPPPGPPQFSWNSP